MKVHIPKQKVLDALEKELKEANIHVRIEEGELAYMVRDFDENNFDDKENYQQEKAVKAGLIRDAKRECRHISGKLYIATLHAGEYFELSFEEAVELGIGGKS